MASGAFNPPGLWAGDRPGQWARVPCGRDPLPGGWGTGRDLFSPPTSRPSTCARCLSFATWSGPALSAHR